MRVLGVDPGIQCVGYAIIDYSNKKSLSLRRGKDPNLVLKEAGVIRTSSKNKLADRIVKIYSAIVQVIKSYKPEVLSLEELYSFYKNPKTAILMAHARGVIYLAAAQENIKICGYAPRKVKKAISGVGTATKLQMQNTIKETLSLKKIPQPHDVADAMALAITHINIASRKI